MPIRILVVGQTPPPFGGQAVMIRKFLDGSYSGLRLFHVRLAFSDSMEEVGRFSMKKVGVLLATILRIWVARFRYRTPVLYYPPSGPNKVPVLRDLVLLCSTRWIFAQVVFHFHAGGVSGFAGQLPAWLRPFFRLAYGRPTLAIRTAEQNPDDGAALGAAHDVVVPNGVRDMRGSVPEPSFTSDGTIVLLFTGVLIPSKGVRVLLEAVQMLIAQGQDVRLELMGRWGDAGFQQETMRFVEANGLAERVLFLGEKRDTEKFRHFAECDIFCFPSYFEAESFGLVLVEAMMFSKPVVTTRWRGIPSVVQDGVNGFKVPIRDARAVADKIRVLIGDPDLRRRMGAEGRRIFEERFTLERFHRNMEQALAMALSKNVPRS